MQERTYGPSPETSRSDREYSYDIGRGVSGQEAAKTRTPEELATDRVFRLRQDVESAVTRTEKLTAIARRDEWRTEQASLKAMHATLDTEVKAHAKDAKASARAQEHYDAATTMLGEIATTLENAKEPSRSVPPVPGEEAIEPSIIDRSAVPDDVLAWVARLGESERRALIGRVEGVGGGSVNRTDGFVVALSNYFRTKPIRSQFLETARNPRRFNRAAYEKARASARTEDSGADAAPQSHLDLNATPAAASSALATPAAASSALATPAASSTYTTPAAASSAHATPTVAHRSALDRALALTQLGASHLEAIRTELVPAYRRAVAAIDSAAVKALALQIVGGVARIVDAQAHVVRLVPQVDTGPHAAMASTSETDAFAPNAAELGTLTAEKAALDAAVLATVPKLAVQVSPQWFGDHLVAGRAAEPPPHVREVLVQLTYEAGLVVQLLDEADTIAKLLQPVNEARGTSEPATNSARSDAVDHLERWRSRPINFLFLARVLTERGLWQSMQGTKNVHGHTAAELQRKVFAQSKETGATADVGALWDADDAHGALSYGTTDWKVTSEEASRVFDMLAQAEPRARGELVKQLYRMGRLGALCEHLPWGQVKQLWESIQDPEASKLLEPYWDGKGGGKSLGKRLEEQDHWYTTAMSRFLDVATFGAKPRIDAAYDAREAGLISSDDYWGSVTKAVGRAAFMAAATAATGGVAGELVTGASEGMGLMAAGGGVTGMLARGATTVASSATAGGVGNVAGHFVGDLYDQALDGKEGFDSLSSYGESFGDGVKLGAATGAVAAVGLNASKFIRGAMRTVAQEAAAAYPQLTRVLEAARSVGVRAGAHVRMTVDEYLKTISGGPRGLRLAYAGAPVPPRIAAASRDAPLSVTVRPLQDLNAPMQSANNFSDHIEIESVKLFDDYGEDASYVDDAADHRADEQPNDPMELDDNIGLAEAQRDGSAGRRSRHVSQRLPPEMEADNGMSALHAARLDITRLPRHHVFPQEELPFFQARGFPGREIDKFTLAMEKLEHDVVHGGNQPLARKHWPGHEWNTKLMERLRTDEALKGANLTRDEILSIMQEERVIFGIQDYPFVHYHAP
jgi:hypothetical protein